MRAGSCMAYMLVKEKKKNKEHENSVLYMTSKLITFRFCFRASSPEIGGTRGRVIHRPPASPRRAQMESQPHTLTGPILPAMLKLLRGFKARGTIRSPCLTSCTSHTIVFHPLIHVLSQITQIWLKCIFCKGIQTTYKALQDEEEKPLPPTPLFR